MGEYIPGMTVEITSEDYPQIRTYLFPGFTPDQIKAVEKVLYDIDYIGARNIRVIEGIAPDETENREEKTA